MFEYAVDLSPFQGNSFGVIKYTSAQRPIEVYLMILGSIPEGEWDLSLAGRATLWCVAPVNKNKSSFPVHGTYEVEDSTGLKIGVLEGYLFETKVGIFKFDKELKPFPLAA